MLAFGSHRLFQLFDRVVEDGGGVLGERALFIDLRPFVRVLARHVRRRKVDLGDFSVAFEDFSHLVFAGSGLRTGAIAHRALPCRKLWLARLEILVGKHWPLVDHARRPLFVNRALRRR